MRKYLEHAVFGVILLGIVVVASYACLQARKVSAPVGASASTDDKPYSTDMNELRTRFNKDKGAVRLLMLLSPT